MDLTPRNGAVEAVAFQDFEGYQAYIAKIYAALTLTGNQGPAGDPDLTLGGDEGFSSYLRVWWKLQEFTTEEAVVAWTDPGIRDLHNHQWGSDNPWPLRIYTRIFFNISMVNDFLRVSSDLPGSLTAEEVTQVEQFRAEARLIRAIAYWHALDMFRNVAILTKISSDLPEQALPEETFQFIEDELLEIEPLMVDPGQNVYGRADRAAVWMLQAKLYLNAPVYIGTDRNADVVTACEKIINSGAYSLAPNYRELFMGDNHLRTDEIIFPIVHDGLTGQTWGGTTTLVRASIGAAMQDDVDENGLPVPDEALLNYGVPSGWDGFRTTSALVNKFPAADGSIDGRAIFFTEGQSLEITDIGQFNNGYAVPKFINIEASTGVRAPGVDMVSTDFPLFRLADAYLMLAEAEVRLNGNVSSATLDLLNSLRQRAYGDNSGDVTTNDVTLDWILDERARELYWEGHRRTDLIRFGRFTGGSYLWPWKGGEAAGVATSDHLQIFPIPAPDIIANPKLEQNDGY